MNIFQRFFHKYSDFKEIIIVIFSFAFIAIFATIMIGKGVDFTSYNLKHIKYAYLLEKDLSKLNSASLESTLPSIESNLINIRQQPYDCLETINYLDRLTMAIIGTSKAYQLCIDDLKVADEAIQFVDQAKRGTIELQAFRVKMEFYKDSFLKASDEFEEPVEVTVSFIKYSMTTLITLSAIFSIVFILRKFDAYMAEIRSTASSLGHCAINLNKLTNISNQKMEHFRKESESLKVQSQQTVTATRQTSGTMHAMDSMIAKSIHAVEECHTFYEAIGKQVESGRSSMKGMEESLGNIEGLRLELNEIASFVQDIKHKADMITDIAFSTKLISFNASVEAARAGEQGRSFAIVAEEIGSLAHTTTSTSSEILNLLADSDSKIDAIISNIDHRSQEVIEKSKSTIDIFEQIFEDLKLFQGQFDKIKLSSEEQKSGVDETVKAIEEINLSIQKNFSISDTMYEASQNSKKITDEIAMISTNITDHMQSLDKHLKSEKKAA